jgi:matrixin
MTLRLRIASLAALIAAVTIFSTDPWAYSLNGQKWNTASVPYYINSANLDLGPGATEAAVRAGANTWALQSGAAIAFTYAGQSAQTTNTLDNINLVLFRDASSGSAIATTYSWFSGSNLLDTDIVFWDAAFTFFSGSSGCASGFYIEDIAAHEFGHALGLGHSSVMGATMFPSVSSCNTGNRSLSSDDIDAVRALYPPVVVRPPNRPTGFRLIG